MNELTIANVPAIVFSPAELTFDETAVREKIAKRIECYIGTTPDEVANMDIKDAKKARADLNAIKKELNDARIAVKREYSKPLKAFEENVHAIEGMFAEPLSVLDAGIKKREENDRNARYQELQQFYYEMTPALVEAIPFDRLLEKPWLSAAGFKKAFKELETKIIKITKQLETLEGMDIKYKVETRRKFLETLDITEACAYDTYLREQDEAAARMDAMRAECMAVNEPEPELEPIVEETEEVPVQPEPEPQKAPEPVAEPEPVYEPEPIEEYEPVFNLDEDNDLMSIRVMGNSELVQQVAEYAITLGLQVM